MSAETEVKVDPFLGLPGIFREVACDCIANFDVSTPWMHDGFVYATDGRIAVRTALELVDFCTIETLQAEASKPLRPRQKPRLGDASRPFRLDYAIREEPTPIPKSVTEKATCDECGGNGISGGENCDDCDGAGWIIPIKPVEIVPGYWLAQRYLELFRRHGARLWVPVEPNDGLRSVFRGLAFEGVLMPMRRPEPGDDA